MDTVEKTEATQAELAEYDITRGKVSKHGVVLRPQPTNDPNEPLVRVSMEITLLERN